MCRNAAAAPYHQFWTGWNHLRILQRITGLTSSRMVSKCWLMHMVLPLTERWIQVSVSVVALQSTTCVQYAVLHSAGSELNIGLQSDYPDWSFSWFCLVYLCRCFFVCLVYCSIDSWWMCVSMEHWWKDTDMGKLKHLVETLIGTFATQTMHGMACVCTCVYSDRHHADV